MKTLKIKPAFRIILTCVFFLLITAFHGSAAEIDDGLSKCAAIKDNNDARLQCFDELAKKRIPAQEAVVANPAEKTVEQKSAAVSQTKQETSPAPVSVMEKYWDLVTTNRLHSFALRPYRSNYFFR